MIKSTPTMADVAKLAGVSAMTVSRALRRDGLVADQTRARVLKVIEQLGYVPDQAAGTLSSGHSGLIAVILPTLSNPQFGQIARGLNETLAPQGLNLFLGFSDYDPAREEQMIEAMLRRRVETIVVAGVDHSPRAVRLLGAAGVPIVEFFDEPSAAIEHVVSIDHVAVGRATTRYLAERRRRRLAVVGPRDGVDPRGERRAAGVVAAAVELGLPRPVMLRHRGPLATMEQGVLGAADVIENHPDIDAIVCMNDYAALGAIGECRRRGVEVPNRLAVVGFGDLELSRHVFPTITTVGFNPMAFGVEIGKVVLSALDEARSGRRLPPCRLAFDFQMMSRESA